MSWFYQDVDKESRPEMVDFLLSHDTRKVANNNPCGPSSFANCIKIPHLSLPDEISDIKYEAIEPFHTGPHAELVIEDFEDASGKNCSMGTAGRSGGYLVLLGLTKRVDTSRRSFCRNCFFYSYKTIPEHMQPFGLCDRCGSAMLRNLKQPIYYYQPTVGRTFDPRHVDDEADIEYLRELTETVQLFDEYCDYFVQEFVDFCLFLKEEKSNGSLCEEVF